VQAAAPDRHLTPGHCAIAERYLSARQLTLFRQMDQRDRLHAAQTVLNLLQMGVDEHDVLVAGLLHDVAKGAQRLPYRISYVLLERFAGPVLLRLARPGGWGPLGAWERSLQHAERSARLARAAGASERACRLIALHHLGGDEPGLDALMQADDRA
jgi:hypothetical protein